MPNDALLSTAWHIYLSLCMFIILTGVFSESLANSNRPLGGRWVGRWGDIPKQANFPSISAHAGYIIQENWSMHRAGLVCRWRWKSVACIPSSLSLPPESCNTHTELRIVGTWYRNANSLLLPCPLRRRLIKPPCALLIQGLLTKSQFLVH